MIPIIEFPRGVLLAEQVDAQENIFVSPEIYGRIPVSAIADAQPPSSLPQAPPEDTSAVPDKPVVPEVNKTPGVAIMNKKDKFKDYWVIKPELREIIYIFLRSRLKKLPHAKSIVQYCPKMCHISGPPAGVLPALMKPCITFKIVGLNQVKHMAILKFPLIAIGPVKSFSCCHLSCRQVLIPKSF